MELFNIIREHISWKKQIGALAIADIRKTYSGAALGWAWAVVKPAVTIFVYWFAFSAGLRKGAGIEGFPFFLWMLAGIIPWFYISEILNRGTGCMRTYKHLITKMKFPVSTIPTFVNISCFVINLGLTAAMLVIYILMGHPPTIYWIQLPLYMAMLFLFCTGWTLFGSVLAGISKDFLNLVKSFTTALFWLSFILFPMTRLGDHPIVLAIIKCNPITFTVEGYRNCLVHGTWFFERPVWLGVYLAELVIMWALGIWAYGKLKKDMPDVL